MCLLKLEKVDTMNNELFDLIYLVYEGKLSTQREFSIKLSLSLGKINTLFKEAINLDYITNDNNEYKITNLGLSLLEEYKVDNAVIMAAGFGSRFVPMTYETPKGLLKVSGEVLIERQIKQLHEVGISDITIVVGYLKESFEYLKDKYKVKLIYNPDYSIKNNISSLHFAKNEFRNTYLLTSDIYMEENLYRKYEYYSYYAAEYHIDKTEEWKVEINRNNEILSIDPKGGSECWAINGPVFFREDLSKTIIAEIEAIYNESYAAQYYWENVLIENLSELKIHIRKFPLNTIIEFESLEELRAFDKSYLIEAQSEILDVITKVFNCNLDEIVNIETLKAGMTNDSFLFEVYDNKYVFRNPGVGTDKLINRSEESEVYSLIKDLEISDELVYMDPSKGYKITKFIYDGKHFDINDKTHLETAMGILRVLHNSNKVCTHDFDIEERINFYHNLCVENRAILFNDFDEVYENINKLLVDIKASNRPKTICHIDPVSTNFLFTKDKTYLLDWEYAGMADPLIDIAMHVIYDSLSKEQADMLLDVYLESKVSEEDSKRLYSYIALGGFLWALWTQYKQSLGEDFGEYGMIQYNYAREYSRRVLNER